MQFKTIPIGIIKMRRREIQDQKNFCSSMVGLCRWRIELVKWTNSCNSFLLQKEWTWIRKLSSCSKWIQSFKTKSEITHECDCSNPESANFFQCDIETKDCIKRVCKRNFMEKCGWMWTYPCNGLCYSKIVNMELKMPVIYDSAK